MGNNKKAAELYEQGLDIMKNSLPENHPVIGRTYAYLGLEYKDQGDNQKAIELYEKALEIYKKSLPKDHPDIARLLANLGKAYFDSDEAGYGIRWLEMSSDMLKKRPEKNSDLIKIETMLENARNSIACILQ